MDKEARELMEGARIYMVRRMPFFGMLAFYMDLKELSEEECQTITTAATDGRHIFYNPQFIKALRTTKDRSFVVAHEVMHAVNATTARRGARDPRLWNIATDFAINEILFKAFDNSLPQINGKDFGVLYDPKYENMTSEHIYEDLKKADSGDTDKMHTLDYHGGAGDTSTGASGNSKDNKDSRTPKTIADMNADEVEKFTREFRGKVVEAHLQAKKYGKTPAGIDRLIAALENPRLPWRELLSTSILQVRAGDYEWVPPNSAFFGQGITIPEITLDEHVKIRFCTDASGSMGDDDIAKVIAEIRGVTSLFRSWEMEVFSFDSEIYPPTMLTSDEPDAVYNLKIKGGGGTNFYNPLKWMAEAAHFVPDITVFFTDGYGEGWHEQEFSGRFKNMVWLLTTEVKPTWGTPVYYDKYS